MTRKKFRIEEYVAYSEAREENDILAQAEAIHLKRLQRMGSITSPTDCAAFLRARYGHLPHEVFAAVLLDSKHHILAVCDLFRGCLSGAEIHPRQVAIACLHHRASSVVYCHNHPSSNLCFSQADIQVTKRLSAALGFLDIRTLDHVLVTNAGTASMAEQGLL